MSGMPRPKDRRFAEHLATTGDPWKYAGPLTDTVVAALVPPSAGNRIKYDTTVKGFGARVTAASARSFVLNYFADRRERRITLGSFPAWSTEQARTHAAALQRRVDAGEDPMRERHVARAAPLMSELLVRFHQEHTVRQRPATQVAYQRIARLHIVPALGRLPVTAVTRADVERLHQSIVQHGTATFANRTVAMLRTVFAFAVHHGLRSDNPARGVKLVREHPKERYLTAAELARLDAVLDKYPDHASAKVIRLLLLTGARRGEVLGATWTQFDLVAGVWTKPASGTKQGRLHRVPLSPPAVALLTAMRATATDLLLFPGPITKQVRLKIDYFWHRVRRQAGIEDVRMHDLRHTYASVLASAGLSLPVIGALLGHSQVTTTQRYSHLLDEALRDATNLAAKRIAGDVA
jgi:integrase